MADKEKVELNSYFASISTLDDSHAVLTPFMELTDSVLDRNDITEEEIKYVIVNLDPNKASGPDLISNKMIKYVARAIAKPLQIILNRSLRESVFPDIWKLGNLVPLCKETGPFLKIIVQFPFSVTLVKSKSTLYSNIYIPVNCFSITYI